MTKVTLFPFFNSGRIVLEKSAGKRYWSLTCLGPKSVFTGFYEIFLLFFFLFFFFRMTVCNISANSQRLICKTRLKTVPFMVLQFLAYK